MRTSRHYANDRRTREHNIRIIGQGRIIASFTVDRGHENGPEIHSITNTGIIIITNKRTGKLITKLIARPGQLRRYNWEAPQYLLDLAYAHTAVNHQNF